MPDIDALKQTIEKTILAVREGQEQVEAIARDTEAEVKRLEAEHDELKGLCLQAIDQVEVLTRNSRNARERLLVVNREISHYSENDMKTAYETAHQMQVELGQWQEREKQLRFRRDEIARRLKSLRVIAQEAEMVTVKFHHVVGFLQSDLGNLTQTLEVAHLQSLLGLQWLQLQEEERRALARRLHDGPMQSLASVAMKLQFIPQVTEQPSLQDDVQNSLSSVIGELRQMVFDLRPPLLDDLGLVPTLKRYVQQWTSQSGIAANIHLVGLETALPPTTKVTVFRVVQEALVNVMQHALASQVDVTLLYGEQTLQLVVTDNGIGISQVDFKGWVEGGKLGLATCRQRLSALGGTLDVQAENPRGTRFQIQLPLLRSADQ